MCGLCWPGPCTALSSGAHCHAKGSRGHGQAWLCCAQPAAWAGLRTQVFHSGVMGAAENWCQMMTLFLQTTGVVTTAVRTWQRPQVPAGSQGCSVAHTHGLWGYQRPELQDEPSPWILAQPVLRGPFQVLKEVCFSKSKSTTLQTPKIQENEQTR